MSEATEADALARADRRAWRSGVVGSLVLAIAGGFWALPHIEDELDEASLGVTSYAEADGYQVEWNGRDGYLSVPEGTPLEEAEVVAADLADLDGVRDVEIAFDKASSGTETQAISGPATTTSETTTPEVTAAPTTTAPPVEEVAGPAVRPANFEVEWSPGSIEQVGEAPEDLVDVLSSLGVALPPRSTEVVVDDGVADDLATLSPLVGTSLTSGSAVVTDGALRIVGVAPSEADLQAATDGLADVEADVSLEIDETIAVAEELDAITAPGIQFETNTNVPTAATEAVIDEIAELLIANPTVEIRIVGHTDTRGDAEANQALSEARAARVWFGLVTRGVEPRRLESTGRGETEPLVDDATNEGQQVNRRVEITIKENDR